WCIFSFQAEDGIRDFRVTGVQTCALPILSSETFPFIEAPKRPFTDLLTSILGTNHDVISCSNATRPVRLRPFFTLVDGHGMHIEPALPHRHLRPNNFLQMSI